MTMINDLSRINLKFIYQFINYEITTFIQQYIFPAGQYFIQTAISVFRSVKASKVHGPYGKEYSQQAYPFRTTM